MLKHTNTLKLSHSLKMPSYAAAFWVFDDDALPCRCCSPIDAMEDGFWNCKERRWLVVDETFFAEHSGATCDGACGNLLHGSYIRELMCAEIAGIGWGDVVSEWEMEELMALSPAEKAGRAAAAEAKEAERLRLVPLLAEHHAQVDRMRRCRITAKERKNQGRKEAAPCRSLYDYQREGGCQSLSVCTECWAHEFTDALSAEIVDEKSGSLKPMAEKLYIRESLKEKECGIFRLADGRFVLKWLPHVCYMSHPGEATWNPEWTQNRNAARPSRGAAVAPRNWRALATPAAPPSIGRPSTNRFSHLEADW